MLITRFFQMRLTTEPELEFEPLRRQVEEAIAALERARRRARPGQGVALLGYERFVQCRIEPAEQAINNAIEHAWLASDERLEAYGRGMLTAAASGPAARHRRHRALLPPAGRRRREPLRRGHARCALGALVAMEGRFGEAREECGQGGRPSPRPSAATT